MHPDASHLHDFYQSRLGRLTAQTIAARITEIWGSVGGLSLLGLGYATPFLDHLCPPTQGLAAQGVAARKERVIALMPARQGVMAWPQRGPQRGPQGPEDARSGNRCGLVDELQLPLPDASFERIILAHILENTEQTRVLLREVWRVLAPGGRLIVITPNRQGLWAPFERTPFGTGRPYSRPQLSEMLADNMLVPSDWRYAMHLPPINNRAAQKLMRAFEHPGQRWWRRLAGILIMEAEKQIYAVPPGLPARKMRRRMAVRISPEGRPHEGRNASRDPS